MKRVKNSAGHTTLESSNESKNDCVLRTFAFCFFKDDFEKSKAYCKEHFGWDNGGIKTHEFHKHLDTVKSIGPKNIFPMGENGNIHSMSQNINSRTKKPCKMTVGAFLKQFPKGTFIISVSGHAFAVKDGEVFGNANDGTKLRVPLEKAYQIKWK